MKIMPIGDKQVLLDNGDFKRLSKWKWEISNRGRVRRRTSNRGKSGHVLLHRAVVKCPKGMEIDHRNGNVLDNRKSNLRICTHTQNEMNKSIRKNNTSGFKGVVREGKKWRAKIKINEKTVHLGSYNDPREAARVYNAVAKFVYGDFAWLNPM